MTGEYTGIPVLCERCEHHPVYERKAMKRIVTLVMTLWILLACPPLSAASESDDTSITMAVEFVDHAACAFVAFDREMFRSEGVVIRSHSTYATGMALAAALTRGDVDAAYICLVPAINAYANGKVPLKVVAGTHRYGYGLVVDPRRVSTVTDLERPDIRLGCPREGSPPDLLVHEMIQRYGLDRDKTLNKIRRMSPPKLLMALKLGQLDGAFMPEQFSTMGEEMGFTMLVTARDLWPHMQGSVLVVTEKLLERHPGIVKKLVTVTTRATAYIAAHPGEASRIVARWLSVAGGRAGPLTGGTIPADLDITAEAILRSLTTRLECSTHIDEGEVQKTIHAMARLGYVEEFDASRMLDLRWNHE